MALSRTHAAPRAHFSSRGASLDLATSNSGELIRKVERGLPYRALQSLETHSGLPVSRLAAIIGIPERTLARRKTSGRLSPDESERLLRISGVFEKAVELFEGDVTAAVSWLTTPEKAFEPETPLGYARTELGAQEVQALIGRLEHGVFS
jgi:putative toxin-antitoxin system antitoxin component (TIGR02293 family)